MTGRVVLTVEDDRDISRLLRTILERAGYEVVQAFDGRSALRQFHETDPDVVLLDVGLPGLDGWELLERIRELSAVPILMLTAEADEADKVRGLEEGADDYVTKPFGNRELVARVGVLLRRPVGDAADLPTPVYEDAALRIDFDGRVVTRDGSGVALTPTEFRVLGALVRNAGLVLSPAQLLDLGWSDPTGASPERVKFTVVRLRRKLGWSNDGPIETVRGFGYRYRSPGRSPRA